MTKKEIIDAVSASAGVSKRMPPQSLTRCLLRLPTLSRKATLSGSPALVHLHRARDLHAQGTIPLPVPRSTSRLLPFRPSRPARSLRML